MVENTVTIVEKNGLQAKHCSLVVNKCGEFKSKIIFEKNNVKIDAKSILGLMSLGVRVNDQVKISCNGEDEAKALEEITKVLKDNNIT